MSRTARFLALKDHPWYGKKFQKLRSHQMASAFITENETVDAAEWERKINRLFLDREKPRDWLLLQELLSCCR